MPYFTLVASSLHVPCKALAAGLAEEVAVKQPVVVLPGAALVWPDSWGVWIQETITLGICP